VDKKKKKQRNLALPGNWDEITRHVGTKPIDFLFRRKRSVDIL
jgi:hypothetical protein